MNSRANPVINQAEPARRIKAKRAAQGDGAVYCVDLAKNHFHVNRYTSTGEMRASNALTRSQFQRLVDNPQRPRALWVMEACGGSHGWGRRLMEKGDQAKLVPPQFVAKQRVGNKNDSNDAEAIFAVHLDTRVKPVPVKSTMQQGQLAVHAARQQLVKSRTATSNHLRSMLSEHGHVTAKGAASLKALVEDLSSVEKAARLDCNVQRVMTCLQSILQALEKEIDQLDEQIKDQVSASPKAQQLMEAPGIGPITASAAVAEYADGVQRFADARAFAANLGITPGEHSTGGKRKLGSITKRGNVYLRKLLVQGANNLVNSACPKPNSKRALLQIAHPETQKSDDLHRFARDLRARKPRHVVVIAVANRMARMIFAMLKSGLGYRAQRVKTPAASPA
jgi:transposase